MSEYIRKEDAIQAIMGHFLPQTYCGEEVDQAKNLAESIINGVPTKEVVQCEDAINRYSALAVLHPCSWEYKEIDELPSVLIKSPTRKKGKWINREHCQVDEDAYEVATCSNCKAEITLEYPYDSFCPNCGKRMESDE